MSGDSLASRARDWADWCERDCGGPDKTSKLLRECASRIEELEAALRQPDRVARIIRNLAWFTPEMRAMLVKEIGKRWPEAKEIA
jgi:hypothetical protein